VTSCAPLIAQAVRVARFLPLRVFGNAVLIDKTSLNAAVRCKARAVQVLGRSIAKVSSFGPREQFIPALDALFMAAKPPVVPRFARLVHNEERRTDLGRVIRPLRSSNRLG
jgi:hypothetical protein